MGIGDKEKDKDRRWRRLQGEKLSALYKDLQPVKGLLDLSPCSLIFIMLLSTLRGKSKTSSLGNRQSSLLLHEIVKQSIVEIMAEQKG